MAEILLCSESFLKTTTNISDNVAGKYILPSLREAQEVKFRGIIGDCLLAKLKELAATDPETHTRHIDDQGNEAYKDLLDRAQFFLAWSAVVEICNRVTYKVGNFGVSKSTDENLQVAPADEVARQQYYYQAKADSCCLDLQNWILQHRTAFPELDACTCAAIRSNLHSAASSGLFLGGARGKILPGGGGCCK